MKISHPEHGGNGESRGVVNQWLPWSAVDLRLPGGETVAPNHQSDAIFDLRKNSF
jgi:hypothetical protein